MEYEYTIDGTENLILICVMLSHYESTGKIINLKDIIIMRYLV